MFDEASGRQTSPSQPALQAIIKQLMMHTEGSAPANGTLS